MINNVRNLTIDKCTGCSLCYQVCPFKAIKMVENDEGFIVPSVDIELCKECGKCANMCPSIHPLQKHYPIDTKLCLARSRQIDNSASGGLFITIARYYIEQLHGVVYGVIFDNEFNCVHAEANTMEDLLPMQNSKYVQSQVGDCFSRAKNQLNDGKFVLFSGTPCQIAALKSYLQKEYETLLTIEVVCHGVPNQKFWKKYIKKHQIKGYISEYRFRNRANKRTWNPASRVLRRSTLEATMVASWGTEHIPARKDPFYNPFIKNESFRESCYNCQYACHERIADITMGDCDSERKQPFFSPYESKSIALFNTDKALKMWNNVSALFEYIDLNYEEEYKVNTPLDHPSSRGPRRNIIYRDIDRLPWPVFKYKYTDHLTFRMIIGKFIRTILRTSKHDI